MSTSLLVTVLTENTAVDGLLNEHGLSLHIHYGDLQILLDFGQSDAFAQNAKRLGIELAKVDTTVLSHAHYDHADGMPAFFACNNHAKLHLSEACAQSCWSTKAGLSVAHYIGIKEGLLEQFCDRLCYSPTARTTTLAPGVHLVPHSTPRLEKIGRQVGMLVLDNEGNLIPDAFAHEQSLVCELDNKRIAVLSSCSHAGLSAITREVQTAFPDHQLAVFIGGLHLVHASDEEVLQVAQVAQAAGIGRIYTGHCTGEHAIELLRQKLPGRVEALYPGLVFKVE